MSDSNWTSRRENGGYNAPAHSSEEFKYSQRDKPIKAIIGITLLLVLALVFSRMTPAPRDVSNTPAAPVGQTMGTAR